jgi:hypothetical protein
MLNIKMMFFSCSKGADGWLTSIEQPMAWSRLPLLLPLGVSAAPTLFTDRRQGPRGGLPPRDNNFKTPKVAWHGLMVSWSDVVEFN